MNILCIIPARSGSKRLPHKNIMMYHDQPLLSWSIQHAKQCKYKMRIILSTDSQEYANIGIKYGAEVPFLRPSSISNDLSSDIECFKHCVNFLKIKDNYYSDIIVHLRPTQPERKTEDLNKCLDTFLFNYSNYDSLRTVIPYHKSLYKMYTIENNILKPCANYINNINEPYNQATQILPQTYLHNGYIDIFKTCLLDQNQISGNKIYPFIMNSTDCIDIDTIKDII